MHYKPDPDTAARYLLELETLRVLGYSVDSIKAQLWESERARLMRVGLESLEPQLRLGVLSSLSDQIDEFVNEYFEKLTETRAN